MNQERKDAMIDRIGYSLNEGTIVLNQERKDAMIDKIGQGIEWGQYCLEPGKEGFKDWQDPANP